MKIMFLNGVMTGQTMELTPSGTTIGRESDNTVQLPMGGVSRYHAKIECDAAGKWVIRDLGSTNGTLVDDVPVSGSTELVNGSVISIGDQLLRCIAPDAVPSGMASFQPAQGNPPPPFPQPAAPRPATPASQQAGGGQQPVFFFRPQNVSSKPATLSTAQIQGAGQAVQTQDPGAFAPPSAPTVSSVQTDVPKLFAKKGAAAKSPQDRRKKLLGNIIFAFLVFIAAAVGIWLWLFLSERTPQEEKPTVQNSNPFFLYYEKEEFSGTDVFRFTLLLEKRESEQTDKSGRPVKNYCMEVTLDETKNNRQYHEVFSDPIPQEVIDKLKQQILDSGFLKLQQKISEASWDSGDVKRIAVGFDDKFGDVTVSGDVSDTFRNVEEIISNVLLERYDLGLINQPVETILADAESFLFQAQTEFGAIDHDPANLLKAIVHYRLALRRYNQFDPKTLSETLKALRTEAEDGLKKAEEKSQSIRNDGKAKINRLRHESEYSEAIRECDRMMQFFPPGSKEYEDFRAEKLEIQDKISKRRD